VTVSFSFGTEKENIPVLPAGDDFAVQMLGVAGIQFANDQLYTVVCNGGTGRR
jgi:hypothetical protein